MKIRKFKVSIRKRSCATKTFTVEATDCETAEKAAMEYAQNLQFSSDDSDYECYYEIVPDGRATEVEYDRPMAVSIREEK